MRGRGRLVVIVEAFGKIAVARRVFREVFGDREVVVLATGGALYDLPGNRLGISENGEPEWTPVSRRRLGFLARALQRTEAGDLILVVTDADRMGELTAMHVWDLARRVGARGEMRRVRASVLEERAVQRACERMVEEPDRHRAEAETLRRLVDRLIGWEFSRRAAAELIRYGWRREWGHPAVGRVKMAFLDLLDGLRRGDVEGSKLLVAARGFAGAVGAVVRLDGQGWGRMRVLGVDRVRRAQGTKLARFLGSTGRRAGVRQALRSYRSLQRLYEKGLASYPRTRSEEFSPEGVETIKAVAVFEGLLPAEAVPREDGFAHEGLRPAMALAVDDVARLLKAEAETEEKKKEEKKEEMSELIAAYERLYRMFVERAVWGERRYEVEITWSDGSRERTTIALDGSEENRRFEEVLTRAIREDRDIEVWAGGALILSKDAGWVFEDFMRLVDERGVGAPSTYVPILASLCEKGYVSEDRFEVREPGTVLLEWVRDREPWLGMNLSAHLERMLEEYEEGRLGLAEMVETLREGSRGRLDVQRLPKASERLRLSPVGI
ncbi:DNA topoisomerase [Thermosulfurimonas sp. F29]|uniref:DNA topoisomerase n=1 Tax=Thermosulfurimonas sp. F29 TaxID=2867247 RepID=UPI001C83CFCF|nr:DNA topoisomerase [Thermosulfurimonas sp. F29]MBX6423362.1 hypothetical protein [Thermosulfurimonas sp. F29]